MKKQIEQVKEFNKVFGIKDVEPSLRFDMIAEELDEYYNACDLGTLTEVADALGDMLYILCGTILAHGMQDKITEVFDEIHRSNMSKIEDGVVLRRADGKVLKGKNYFKPNIKAILNK